MNNLIPGETPRATRFLNYNWQGGKMRRGAPGAPLGRGYGGGVKRHTAAKTNRRAQSARRSGCAHYWRDPLLRPEQGHLCEFQSSCAPAPLCFGEQPPGSECEVEAEVDFTDSSNRGSEGGGVNHARGANQVCRSSELRYFQPSDATVVDSSYSGMK